MGGKWITRYANINKLYEDVDLAEIAEEHKSKTGGEPVIVVDGNGVVWYLYRNCDFHCGGQYKEFREACRNLTQKFRSSGVRLVFFFDGLTSAEKNGKLVEGSREGVKKSNKRLGKEHASNSTAKVPKQLPEGLIPCARVIFKCEPSCEVRLCVEDYHQEIAQFAASHRNCLGILSNTGNFLIYKDVPSMFLLHSKDKQGDRGVRTMRYCSSDIASHLGIQQHHLPAVQTFLASDTINRDEMRNAHRRIGELYGRKELLESAVAELVKNNTLEEMCHIAFGDRWRVNVDRVKAEIDHYSYKRRTSERTPQSSSWSNVLQHITDKHSTGEIPAVLLSVAKCRALQVGAALEDLSNAKSGITSLGEQLQRLRSRIYTVLLWESGDGPFQVEEKVTRKTEVQRTQVVVQKQLPPSVVHPGLLKLWSGDLETRWRLFSWIVGFPQPSALRSLEPQCLVVPATALHFLRHETCLLSRHEAEIFAVVAVTVSGLTPQQLAQKSIPTLDPHAIFLATLFIRTALHVLDAAAVCGLSFPQEADCHLDAYFDGKLFHELYLSAKAQSFRRVGTHASWNPSHLNPIHKLLNIIEQAN
ncbi:constitutive coactivator of peroxisome proliferator-activated receptor gamma-like [Schistocerca americana]|uniref:constitutive coactivator of peroxisome proliferator-activated receptor gamma-like n=1 Tax=Schistocerca americana TaxID=7009 RepID=UPI001F500A85|nr:constitutive coactivator of peroxisome proliferator-activated receptor gamma-like [Schistocerca americana]